MIYTQEMRESNKCSLRTQGKRESQASGNQPFNLPQVLFEIGICTKVVQTSASKK